MTGGHIGDHAILYPIQRVTLIEQSVKDHLAIIGGKNLGRGESGPSRGAA
jgi:hypothetical protein